MCHVNIKLTDSVMLIVPLVIIISKSNLQKPLFLVHEDASSYKQYEKRFNTRR
ncbi:hypothetical protein LguiB_035417 [Lonicera macranthoides]